jgi:6-phosphogluconolactonase
MRILMNGIKGLWAAGLVLAVLALVSASLNAQSYLYTNNDVLGPNSISAFSIGGNGALTSVAGSPFATGGTGTGAPGLILASNRVAASIAGNFLYASNCGSNNVSGFSINPATGTLTAVPGSPFPTGGACAFGGAVAVTPNNQFLYVANISSFNVSAFGIGSGGALTPVPGSPFATVGFPVGTKVSPDGKFLVVSLPGSALLAMFSIASNGALTPVVGSPFTLGGTGAEEVDINCASNLLFAAGANLVSVHNIASNGALTPIAGSPFTFGGGNSNVVVLSPDDLHAFVSNQVSNTITALNVAPGGSLTQVAGSPFANPGGAVPFGMATNRSGTFLYAANGVNLVTGFSVAGNGALAPMPGSPFATHVPGVGLESLVVYPAKSCVIPFAAFAARADIAPADREFEVDATFTLGASSDGIKPIAEAVSLTVGTFSTTIPAGSFKLNKGSFVFEGVINGVALEAEIRPLGSNRFEFKVQGERANLSGTVNPVMIVLTIGNDRGDVTVRRTD